MTPTAAGDSHVSVPLGLVALTWVRLFHPLIRGDFPQAPLLPDGRGLSFVKDGFREILKLPAGDLRIGMRFSGEPARALHAALKDARDTMVDQPVRHTKIPERAPLLRPLKRPVASSPSDLILDEPYFLSFGELHVPRDVWHAMQRFSVWVESTSSCNLPGGISALYYSAGNDRRPSTAAKESDVRRALYS